MAVAVAPSGLSACPLLHHCLLVCCCPAGPAIHGEVGDTLVVVLKNNLDFPINILPGGVHPAGGAPLINPGDVYTAR